MEIVLLAQFSLYVHKSGLKPDLFYSFLLTSILWPAREYLGPACPSFDDRDPDVSQPSRPIDSRRNLKMPAVAACSLDSCSCMSFRLLHCGTAADTFYCRNHQDRAQKDRIHHLQKKRKYFSKRFKFDITYNIIWKFHIHKKGILCITSYFDNSSAHLWLRCSDIKINYYYSLKR